MRAAYLVIDCLRPILDALGLDEHREAGQFLVALDALLDEAGIGEALLVHHMGHTGERSRGDSRLRDWPDVEWSLVRKTDDPASPRFFRAFGRDVDVPEGQLAYDPETRRLSLVGGSRQDVRTDAVIADVLDFLQSAAAPQSGRAIKAALRDSSHSRDLIEAAIARGIESRRLVASEGPRNAKLYRPGPIVASSVRVSGSVRLVSENSESECPAAYIRPDTRTLDHEVVSVRTGDDDAGRL